MQTSNEPGTWVVGLDGSDGARNALEWAILNAPDRASRMHLLTAWQMPIIGAYPMSPPPLPLDDSEQRAAAADDVLAVAACVRKRIDIPVSATIGNGGAAHVLLSNAVSADLLVLGSRGSGGFARLLLGSTSTQCATHAVSPTAVIPGDVEARRAERLLVGVDGSENSMVALRWAIDFAAPGTTIVVAWVWDTTPLAVGADSFYLSDAGDLAAERFEQLVDSVAAQAADAGVTLEPQFLRGTARTTLATLADDADLVAVGARGHGAVGAALLGSVSTWLLHHVHRPMVVVPVDQ